MSSVFRTSRRVEFAETDAAAIAHFASFLRYMEEAEHQLLRSIGWSVMHQLTSGQHLTWPRVHVECDFQGAARFEDVLDIAVTVARLGTRSVTYAFQFSLGEQAVASGKIVAVCCHLTAGGTLAPADIPDELRAKLQPFVSAS
ncbi:MAG: thioesterase family protein [Pirellulales bacterium]